MRYAILLFVSILPAIHACAPVDKSDQIATDIQTYTVTGSTSPVSGIVQINAGVNSGNFQMDWKIVSTDPFTITLYLSGDSALEQASDIAFHTNICGSSDNYTCASTTNLACQFTSANLLSCGTITAANQPVDITAFLDQIPKTGYLILEACNSLLNSCDVKFVEAQFQ